MSEELWFDSQWWQWNIFILLLAWLLAKNSVKSRKNYKKKIKHFRCQYAFCQLQVLLWVCYMLVLMSKITFHGCYDHWMFYNLYHLKLAYLWSVISIDLPLKTPMISETWLSYPLPRAQWHFVYLKISLRNFCHLFWTILANKIYLDWISYFSFMKQL